MIPISPQPEPHDFHIKVRQPGIAFLVGTPNPTSKEFTKAAFWKNAAHEVYEAYSRVCAYTGTYIYVPYGTIDHFKSKSAFPQQAYEWNNFRLCAHRVNVHKGAQEVLDPFAIMPGWFAIDFPSCLIRPGDGLNIDIHDRVLATISALRLNDDDTFVQERCDIMYMFAQGDVSLGYLIKRRPFLAQEVVRQGIEATAAEIFKMPS